MKKELENKKSAGGFRRKSFLILVIFGVLVCLSGCTRTKVILHDTAADEENGSLQTQEVSPGETQAVAQSAAGGISDAADPGTSAVAATGEPFQTGQTERRLILVHVCGAVNRPGVYYLAEGARAVEAVNAAGGMRSDADADRLNLAKTVEDGQQLKVPVQGEEPSNENDLSDQSASDRETAASGGEKVNINTADETLLMTLTGIGASKAAAIIEYRKRNGSFSSIEQIKLVTGIKGSVFEKIKDNICV